MSGRSVRATIALTLLAGCAFLVWRLVSCEDCVADRGMCATDLADIRVWYPSTSPSRFTRLISLVSVKPACRGAGVSGSSQPFPVLLYFGGWPGTSVNNTELIGSLARAGFVVVTRLYPPSTEAPMDFSSEAAYRDTLVRADSRVRALAADATAAIDRIIALNRGEPASPFSGRLDTAKIGILGYSLGGAVAAQAAWSDPRIKAVLNIDGWLFADAATHGVRQPYLLISDDTPMPGPADLVSSDLVHRYSSMLTKDDYERLLHNFSVNGGLFIIVAGTEHTDFPDRGRRSRLRDALGWSPDRAGRVQKLLRAYTASFFQSVLQDVKTPLLQGPSVEFPEARLQHWDGAKEGGR